MATQKTNNIRGYMTKIQSQEKNFDFNNIKIPETSTLVDSFKNDLA